MGASLSQFVKLSEGVWVNLAHVASIHPKAEGSYRVFMSNGQQLTASQWDVTHIENLIDPAGANDHRIRMKPKT
jgi:DNA-binding LytR/AlgR family response regulator